MWERDMSYWPPDRALCERWTQIQSLKSGREFMQDQAAIVSKSLQLPRYTILVSAYVKHRYHISKFVLLYVQAWFVLVHYPPSSRFQNKVSLRCYLVCIYTCWCVYIHIWREIVMVVFTSCSKEQDRHWCSFGKHLFEGWSWILLSRSGFVRGPLEHPA